MKQRLVDFSDPILSAALFILLKDRTTGKNIIWATEPPPELGAGFSDEITLEQIKKCPPVPRVLKRLDEQKKRTKAKAEVFTPSLVCEKMIDMGEENGAMPDMKSQPSFCSDCCKTTANREIWCSTALWAAAPRVWPASARAEISSALKKMQSISELQR